MAEGIKKNAQSMTIKVGPSGFFSLSRHIRQSSLGSPPVNIHGQ